MEKNFERQNLMREISSSVIQIRLKL